MIMQSRSIRIRIQSILGNEDMTRSVIEEMNLSGFATICQEIRQNQQTGKYTNG